MSDESRAALEEAWDAAEASIENPGEELETPKEPDSEISSEPEEEPESEESGTDGDVPSGEEPGEPVEEPESEERPTEEEPSSGGDTGEPGRVDEGHASAPSSWTPQAREAWGDIPEAARAEIQRRENEVSQTLRDTSDARRELDRLNEAVKPFEQTLAIEANGDPVTATRNLLGVATRLRFGTAQEKAQLVSQLVNDYGVDVEALDNALAAQVTQPGAGAGYPPPGNPIPAPVAADPRVDQMWNAQQQSQQRIVDDNRQAAEAFMADPKNEFAQDVRQDMADLMEVSFKRGQNLTLEDAYSKACAVNANVQAVIAQRGGAPAAGGAGHGAPAADLRAKKRAAKSVKGSPSAGASKKEPQTREEQLRASWDAHANG